MTNCLHDLKNYSDLWVSVLHPNAPHHRSVLPDNLLFLETNVDDPCLDHKSSRLRRGNFDLPVLLATEETIHRVLYRWESKRVEGDVVAPFWRNSTRRGSIIFTVRCRITGSAFMIDLPASSTSRQVTVIASASSNTCIFLFVSFFTIQMNNGYVGAFVAPDIILTTAHCGDYTGTQVIIGAYKNNTIAPRCAIATSGTNTQTIFQQL